MLFLLALQVANGFWWPGQIHLSWTENPKEMRVTWLSRLSGDPVIELSSECDSNKNIDYSINYIDFGTNTKRMGYVYSAVIKDLEANCTYEYQVKNGIFRSDFHSFKGKTHGDESEDPHKVVIFGDLGIGTGSQSCVKGMGEYLDENEDIIALMHLGDIAYDIFTDEGKRGDDYGEMIEYLASEYAYMTVPGNHELKANYSHYYNRYIMPKNVANNNTGLFYSLKLGLIKYIFLNTNILGYASQEESDTLINWLKAELEDANLNRHQQPWVIALQHQPLYCAYDESDDESYKNCIKNTAKLRKYLEDIYYYNKVDLVLQGHVHKYERDSAVYNNTDQAGPYDTQNMHIDAQAPIYIVSGIGGTSTGVRDPIVDKEIDWVRFQHLDYGFGALTSFNRTHLLWEQFDGKTLERLDYVYLIKTYNS